MPTHGPCKIKPQVLPSPENLDSRTAILAAFWASIFFCCGSASFLPNTKIEPHFLPNSDRHFWFMGTENQLTFYHLFCRIFFFFASSFSIVLSFSQYCLVHEFWCFIWVVSLVKLGLVQSLIKQSLKRPLLSWKSISDILLPGQQLLLGYPGSPVPGSLNKVLSILLVIKSSLQTSKILCLCGGDKTF